MVTPIDHNDSSCSISRLDLEVFRIFCSPFNAAVLVYGTPWQLILIQPVQLGCCVFVVVAVVVVNHSFDSFVLMCMWRHPVCSKLTTYVLLLIRIRYNSKYIPTYVPWSTFSHSLYVPVCTGGTTGSTGTFELDNLDTLPPLLHCTF